MRYASLYIFHFIHFIATGCAAFLSKYYGEIGLSDGRIGLLTSAATILAMGAMPLLGSLSDRIGQKRALLAAELAVMAAACFAAWRCERFVPLLLTVSLYTVFTISVLPLATTISLEYCAGANRPYGPIRLLGTVGYQAGALLVGALLAKSLRDLFAMMGVCILLSAAATALMPDVRGHQQRRERIPLRRLFADRRLKWLYGMILFASVTTQFYNAFFGKYMGDLGMSNALASKITFLSVLMELPFLLLGDRIRKWTTVWSWLRVGFIVNGVRWLGLAFLHEPAAIVLFQLPGVTVLACFEFIPAFYLSTHVSDEMLGSAQSMLSLVIFGAGKIIGSLLGGLVSQRAGIPAVFAFNGAMLLLGCAAFWRPMSRLIREEKEETEKGMEPC